MRKKYLGYGVSVRPDHNPSCKDVELFLDLNGKNDCSSDTQIYLNLRAMRNLHAYLGRALAKGKPRK